MLLKTAEEMHEKWDLSDLYTNESEMQMCIKNINEKAAEFKTLYLKIFESFDKEKFLKSIEDYEEIYEVLYKLMSYAALKHSINLDDEEVGKLYQNVQSTFSKVNASLVFFENGICKKFSKQELNTLFPNEKYKPWLEQVLLYKDHVLSDEIEAYSSEKSLSSVNAWIRLYDETLSDIKFEFNGKILTLEGILDQMQSLDENVRKKAAGILNDGLSFHMNTFVRITNTLAQDKHVEDRYRRYKAPDESRHLANQIDKEVVDLLAETVKEEYQSLSHRYYQIKAKVLGKKELEYWDQNVPLFVKVEKNIPYSEARDIVLDAYHSFSPAMESLVKKFFDNPWIEVYPGQGKTSGAFSHPTVPSVHPYILLNYQGKIRDVMTLAHELGHGAHQILAKDQGLFLSDTPLTIAETASVFGEMLTFEHLKKLGIVDPKTLIASKIDDMLNTVVRQIAFYEFEQKVHGGIREKGELTSTEIQKIWRETQKKALGPNVRLDPMTDSFWTYISHFIHAPFYVYAYAFGDCLVNSLYSYYQFAEDKKDFEVKYLDFLKAGGSKGYVELLKPFNLNPKEKSFWQGGLSVIKSLIDELESLI